MQEPRSPVTGCALPKTSQASAWEVACARTSWNLVLAAAGWLAGWRQPDVADCGPEQVVVDKNEKEKRVTVYAVTL